MLSKTEENQQLALVGKYWVSIGANEVNYVAGNWYTKYFISPHKRIPGVREKYVLKNLKRFSWKDADRVLTYCFLDKEDAYKYANHMISKNNLSAFTILKLTEVIPKNIDSTLTFRREYIKRGTTN